MFSFHVQVSPFFCSPVNKFSTKEHGPIENFMNECIKIGALSHDFSDPATVGDGDRFFEVCISDRESPQHNS